MCQHNSSEAYNLTLVCQNSRCVGMLPKLITSFKLDLSVQVSERQFLCCDNSGQEKTEVLEKWGEITLARKVVRRALL